MNASDLKVGMIFRAFEPRRYMQQIKNPTFELSNEGEYSLKEELEGPVYYHILIVKIEGDTFDYHRHSRYPQESEEIRSAEKVKIERLIEEINNGHLELIRS